jgi:hypothetical protein
MRRAIGKVVQGMDVAQMGVQAGGQVNGAVRVVALATRVEVTL